MVPPPLSKQNWTLSDNPFTQQTELDADETKLDGIEASADVNVGEEYTQTEKTKLAGIDTGADANVGVEYTQTEKNKLGSVETSATRDQTGSQIVNAIDAQLGNADWQEAVDQTARTAAAAAQTTADGAVTVNATQQTELDAINPFTAADETKLDGIEASADANVGVEYTQTEKTKLAGIEAGAEANVGVHSD